MFIIRVKSPQLQYDLFIKRVNRVDLFIKFYQNEKKKKFMNKKKIFLI